MSVLQAILLGAVQGVTEFFPVSSSGHLTLVSNLLGVEGSASLMFMIMLHVGTLIAVVAVFYRDILRLASELVRMLLDLVENLRLYLAGRKSGKEIRYRKIVSGNYRKFALLLLVSMIPTCVIALLICPLTEALTGNLLASGMGLMITALLLLVASFVLGSDKGPMKARYSDAVLIGAFQGFSAFPGISRLGMTAASGYLNGFSRKFVIKYAFVLSVPVILGAMILEGRRANFYLGSTGILPCIAAMVTAAVVGYFTIKAAIRLISRKRLRGFAGYCIVMGILSVIGYLR
jgi:undecaprenyl-diphosphatase